MRRRAALIFAGGGTIRRHLGVGWNFQLGERACIEAHCCRRGRKDGTGCRGNGAKKTMRLLGRKVAWLILTRARASAMADDEGIAVRARQRERGMTKNNRAQQELKHQRAACSGGHPLPQQRSISTHLEHRSHLASPRNSTPRGTEVEASRDAARFFAECDAGATSLHP